MSDARWNVAVLLGGPSSEREVSLRSGKAVAGALRELGHRVDELDPVPGALEVPADADVVFVALHGTYGEDGGAQLELEKLGVPYTGSGVEACRVAFDKVLAKRRFIQWGIPTPRYEVIRRVDAPWPSGWRLPVVLKPVRQGSSVGLVMVDDLAQWPGALGVAFRHDNEVLMEERVEGMEVTLGILGGRPLPLVEIRPPTASFDYRSKYTAGVTQYTCPARLTEGVTALVRKAGWEAFASVGGRDYGRVDIMVREDGSPEVLEVNTHPGMTETSLLPKAAGVAGITFAQLCFEMIEAAMRRAGKAGGRGSGFSGGQGANARALPT